ncbi:MAG: hypothetical protein IBX67_03300 [Dehalococcoidia bacterium]|nr:hypothetical protein [Dehalococcoidia bacterium]
MGWNNGSVIGSHPRVSVAGHSVAGGLVGYNSAIISNSYSMGTVTGDERVGGLVGINAWWGTVSNSYAASAVSGNEHAGGLAGLNEEIVRNSFWDTQASGQTTSDGGTGKTHRGNAEHCHLQALEHSRRHSWQDEP